jgi:lipoprotein NlpD
VGRLLLVLIAATLAACASRPPAPVVDRSPPPRAAAPAAKPAPAPAAAAETPGAETYTVKRGDTLYSIALDHGMDWREVASLNGITDPSRLQAGQVLRLRAAAPAAAAGGVQVSPVAGSTAPQARPLGADAAPGPVAAAPLPPPAAPAGGGMLRTEPKAVKLPYSEENLAALQRPEPARPAPRPDAPAAPKPEPPAVAATPQPPKPAAEPPRAQGENLEDGVEWSWPAGGKLIAGFSDTSKGMQFAGRMGDPVLATAAGEVVYVGTGIRGLGKLVVIRHNEKYLSVYGHNRDIVVKEKQKVALGQKIAEVGNTDADQPKLHFEIRRFGKPVDPMQFLPARP